MKLCLLKSTASLIICAIFDSTMNVNVRTCIFGNIITVLSFNGRELTGDLYRPSIHRGQPNLPKV